MTFSVRRFWKESPVQALCKSYDILQARKVRFFFFFALFTKKNERIHWFIGHYTTLKVTENGQKGNKKNQTVGKLLSCTRRQRKNLRGGDLTHPAVDYFPRTSMPCCVLFSIKEHIGRKSSIVLGYFSSDCAFGKLFVHPKTRGLPFQKRFQVKAQVRKLLWSPFLPRLHAFG